MTWLKGNTTWANCVSDLTKLACGEIADGSSVTCASGDQWVRETAGQDLLRTPASKDVALGNMSNRMGYFTLYSQSFGANATDSGAPIRTVVRLTNIATSNPATTAGRWLVIIRPQTTNTVAGNYSTALYAYQVYDADNGTLLVNSTSLSMSSGGVATLANGMQVTFSDPSGFLSVSSSLNYARGFTTTYVGGIDYWGIMHARRSGASSFSVNPSGTSSTDWDVVSIPVGFTDVITGTPGGIHKGLGIKTNTGLSGNLYTCTWSAALNKIRMVAQSGGSNGQIAIECFNGGEVDTVFQNPTYRTYGYNGVTQWLRPYQTPASVTNASVIQYWMSVKSDKIVIVLNADPAQTGKLTCNWVGTLTPQFPTYDKFPVALGGTVADYTVDRNVLTDFFPIMQFKIAAAKHRQDGSESPRDWQTGWMRSDFQFASIGTDSFSELGTGANGVTTYSPMSIGFQSSPSGFGTTNSITSLPPTRQQKPYPLDNNWWLYNCWFTDIGYQFSSATFYSNAVVDEIPRGKIDGPWYFIPGDGWTSGDELTDTNTSKVYFLIAADYHRVGARLRTAASTYFGGAAILEE